MYAQHFAGKDTLQTGQYQIDSTVDIGVYGWGIKVKSFKYGVKEIADIMNVLGKRVRNLIYEATKRLKRKSAGWPITPNMLINHNKGLYLICDNKKSEHYKSSLRSKKRVFQLPRKGIILYARL